MTELEEYLVIPIADLQNQESENLDSKYWYIDIEVKAVRQPSSRD